MGSRRLSVVGKSAPFSALVVIALGVVKPAPRLKALFIGRCYGTPEGVP
jgi:hypothetical protein